MIDILKKGWCVVGLHGLFPGWLMMPFEYVNKEKTQFKIRIKCPWCGEIKYL